MEGRQILDVVLIANEAIDSMLRSKDCCLLYKLDLKKANNHVELRFLILVMDKIGFGQKWMK